MAPASSIFTASGGITNCRLARTGPDRQRRQRPLAPDVTARSHHTERAEHLINIPHGASMKRVLCNALAAIAAVSTLMLAGTRMAEAATPKDMLVMATLLDEFTTLDPGEIYELVPQEYVANTYDRLIRVDLKDPAHFNGDVAQSWAVSADGLTFTFKIRSGLKFH